jgi:DNA-binding SARP family transcriptional activator
VWSGGRPVQGGAPMQRALLAALLLHANEIVAAEQLIDYLWGETPPPSARTTLQNYVLRLRRLLPERPDGAARQVLVTRAPGYLIRLQPEELDLDRFQRLVAGARASATQGQFERAASTLRDALALWRGSPLCDVAAEALRRTHVPRLEEQRLAALEARIDADLHLGRHAELIAELKGLVEDQPLQERFRAQLMLALYRCGRQAEALQVYRSTWRRLQEELGIQPGPELRELEQAILREDLSLHLPAIPAAGRPHAAAIGRPHQLPPAIADFTGRVRELERLDRLLEPDEPAAAVVISAIVGTAGVGKTALAVHWAQRAREQFPDGQLYANLRGYAPTPPLRPIQALAGFLHALGVAAEQVPVDLDEAAAMYRTLLARKRMLVLDNACGPERSARCCPAAPAAWWWSPAATGWMGWSPARAPSCSPLDVLDPQEAGVLLTRLLGQQRVRAEPEAAAMLARACALLPLALRIAAANLAHRQHQPLASYVMELEAGNRLAALEACGDEHAVAARRHPPRILLAAYAHRRLAGGCPCWPCCRRGRGRRGGPGRHATQPRRRAHAARPVPAGD